MPKKYGITCTMIYNGYMEIEANSEEEALKLARIKMVSPENKE